jgi:hypothetical protein
MTVSSLFTRAALVIAHPGHELRVHGWFSAARPVTQVLTDGSGTSGISRVSSTEQILRDAGAERGKTFAPLSDAEAYRLILGGKPGVFREFAEALAEEFKSDEISCVVGDESEGYNPVHDVCRLLINAAVAIVRRSGRSLENWSFPLAARPDAPRPGEVRFVLTDRDFQTKLNTASQYKELAPEVAVAARQFGLDVFRHEVFAPVEADLPESPKPSPRPFYEIHGERRVIEGTYREVIRYRDHIAPIAAELQKYAATPCGS